MTKEKEDIVFLSEHITKKIFCQNNGLRSFCGIGDYFSHIVEKYNNNPQEFHKLIIGYVSENLDKCKVNYQQGVIDKNALFYDVIKPYYFSDFIPSNTLPSNVIKPLKSSTFEPKNEELDYTPHSNKKQKPTFFPKHQLVVKDGKVVLESIIMAIADLVWREPNKRDLFYIDKLDLSNLTEAQTKYVKAVFYPNKWNKNIEVLQNNLYWTVEKSGRNNILVPLRKREGYYYIHNKTGMPGFVSLTTVSTKLNILKMTAKKRLDRMTLKDLVAMCKGEK